MIGKIKEVHPTGKNVLVELLTDQEQFDTSTASSELLLPSPHSVKKNQGFILEFGPGLTTKEIEEAGVSVGDRVAIVGNYMPCPDILTANGREKGICILDSFKAIYKQESILAIN